MKFKVIDCKNYVYISSAHRYAAENLSSAEYMFDGKRAEKTNKEYWYKLNSIPTVIMKKQSNIRENERYELKAGYTPSSIMPSIITLDQYSNGEYDEIINLYNRKYDEVDGGYKEIEFEIENIYERKDFEFVPNKWHADVDLLTQIEYAEEVYQDRPCNLSSEQMFKIIRNYIKENIDPSVAQITSDYDFHFEVSKRIRLAESYSQTVDTNNSWLNKRRKPKWVTNMITDKSVCVLNIKNKSASTDYGKDCTLAPSITGENYNDLNNKVETYLKELLTMINKRYCECPNCKGWGLIEA